LSSRVAEASERAPPDELVDGDRLSSLVVEEVQLRVAREDRRAVVDLEMGFDGGSDYLLIRNCQL
jgi:hypothetical protein